MLPYLCVSMQRAQMKESVSLSVLIYDRIFFDQLRVGADTSPVLTCVFL